MDITLVGLLVFLVLAALWRPAEMDTPRATWISNGSSQTVNASLKWNTPSYPNWIDSGIVIVPGDHQGSQYAWGYVDWGINIGISVAGGCCQAILTVPDDRSVVVLDDHSYGGLSLFLAIYGKLFQPEGNKLIVLYPEMFLNPDGTLGNCVNVC